MYRNFFLLFILTVVIALGVFLLQKPALTTDKLRQAYHQYAAYQEKYYDIDQYSSTFPVKHYSLYKVQNYQFFIEPDKKDHIKSILLAGKPWEPYLRGYMAKYIRKNSQVVDVGAHIGTHTVYFSTLVGERGQVYAFEPQLKIFLELNANLLANRANNVKTFRYALGDKMGRIEMNKSEIENEGGTAVGHGGDRADQITLDSLKLNNVSFIKIDVEGYEDHVLDGAVKTITQNKPVILCEIQGHVSPENATSADKARIKQTLGKFKAWGYRILQVGPADYLALPASKS